MFFFCTAEGLKKITALHKHTEKEKKHRTDKIRAESWMGQDSRLLIQIEIIQKADDSGQNENIWKYRQTLFYHDSFLPS